MRQGVGGACVLFLMFKEILRLQSYSFNGFCLILTNSTDEEEKIAVDLIFYKVVLNFKNIDYFCLEFV